MFLNWDHKLVNQEQWEGQKNADTANQVAYTRNAQSNLRL